MNGPLIPPPFMREQHYTLPKESRAKAFVDTVAAVLLIVLVAALILGIAALVMLAASLLLRPTPR